MSKFAGQVLESGCDVYFIQRLMGDSSVRATSVYLHVTRKNLTDIVSPIDMLQLPDKPPFHNAERVVKYLGRTTHRVALSNDRIAKLERERVTNHVSEQASPCIHAHLPSQTLSLSSIFGSRRNKGCRQRRKSGMNLHSPSTKLHSSTRLYGR